MELLKKYGIPTVEGTVAKTPSQVYEAAQSFPTEDLVIKAQVLAGGRGKGYFDNGVKGGVQLAYSAEEARDLSQNMLGHKLITKQTGTAGRPCNSVK